MPEQSLKLIQPPDANTLGARLAARQNNLDFLRLAAALLVIVSHSWPLRDGSDVLEPYRRLSGYCTLGQLSIGIFFIVSGLLVARSYLSDSNPVRYLHKRARRIFPGLLACVLFCVLCLGPAFTSLSLKDYLFNHETFNFARNALLYPNHYRLPGVFDQFAATDSRSVVNGSLWSLPLEFLMYLGVLALGVTRLLNRRWVIGLVVIALTAQWIIAQRFFELRPHDYSIWSRYRIWLETVPMMGALFFAGTLMFLYRDSIRLDWRVFLACVVVMAATWQNAQGHFVLRLPFVNQRPLPLSRAWHAYLPWCLCLPYVVIYLAFVRLPVLQSATKWGDFSYGVYLYGYPAQQVLMRTLGLRLPFPVLIGASCVLALGLAAISWHLVEKRFVKATRPVVQRDKSFILNDNDLSRAFGGMAA